MTNQYQVTVKCVRCAKDYTVNKNELRTPYYCWSCK